jgi:hypothetical protein
MKKKEQKTPVVTKIPLKSDKYPCLWFDNQEDLDSFDSLMRKKVFYQNAYGEKGDKDFIVDGTKATFGIFSKDFQEKVFKNSTLLEKQLDYVSLIINIIFYSFRLKV